MERLKLLGCISSQEPSDFNELCRAMKDADIMPAGASAWRELFVELEKCEREGLVEIDRAGGRLQQVQLTPDGAALIKDLKDKARPLFGNL